MKKYTLKKSMFKDLPDGDYSGLAFVTKVFFATPGNCTIEDAGASSPRGEVSSSGQNCPTAIE